MQNLRQDNFNRADSASTLNPPSDVGSSYELSGTSPVWGIHSNQAYLVSGTGHCTAVLDCGATDHSVSCTMLGTSLDWLSSIVVRYQDASNYARVMLQYNGIYFYTVIGGVVTWVSDQGAAFAPSSGDSIRVVAQGTAIHVLYTPVDGVEGTSIWTGVNTQLANLTTGTKAGIGSGTPGTTCLFDNLLITDLAFPPTVTATPYVATSGKMVGFVFETLSNQAALPTSISSVPTIAKNGISLGALSKPFFTINHQMLLYAFPAGTFCIPSDTITITAPDAWCTTVDGTVHGFSNQSIENCTGRSAVWNSGIKRTLKPGWNIVQPGFISGDCGNFLKDWSVRLDAFPGVSVYTADGRPYTSSFTGSKSAFYSVIPANNVDQTVTPPPPGYWAVGWDDDNPGDPTTCALIDWYSGTDVLVTEVTSLENTGTSSGGRQVGRVRVFDVQPTSIVPSNSESNLTLQITNATGSPRFSNLVIFGPGDFSYTLGTPVVLDKSDRFAESNVWKSRFSKGCGSVRVLDSILSSSGQQSACEPEQYWQTGDFTYGLSQGKWTNSIYPSSARPWNQSVTPYIYTTLFGSPYSATLSAPISDLGSPQAYNNCTLTVSTITISDAATAPVLVGLRLLVDNELMRVLSVSGTSVTVERGTCSTTIATHSAGTIQVQYRWLATDNVARGMWFEFVCSSPHLLHTGEVPRVVGSWPLFTLINANGHTSSPAGNWAPPGLPITGMYVPVYVTGANTFLGTIDGYVDSDLYATLQETYTLDGTSIGFIQPYPLWPAFPYAVNAKNIGKISGCNICVPVSIHASDTFVDFAAREIRDNFPSGRTVYVELGNEPWNSNLSCYQFSASTAMLLYPSGNYLDWQTLRTEQIKQRFVDRFNEGGRNRGGEIKSIINRHRWNGGNQIQYSLTFGLANNCIPDYVAVAPYTSYDASSPIVPQMTKAYWEYDDEQAIDLWIHNLYYNVGGNGIYSLKYIFGFLDIFNGAHGTDIGLMGYEGDTIGLYIATDTTLSSGVSGSDSVIPIAVPTDWSDLSAFVVGTPILVGSEWMTITGVGSNSLTVNRGQNGTMPVSHTTGTAVRTAYLERSNDLLYNSNFHQAQLDFYALVQMYNFKEFHSFFFSGNKADRNSWFGVYHAQQQDYGRGDGSDNKTDNKLCLATPGKTHTKSATTSQEVNSNGTGRNVSVRGQAFLDWMSSLIVPSLPRSDTFIRSPDSPTSLGSPTDGGSDWQVLNCVWGTLNGRAFCDSGTGNGVAVLDTGATDYSVSVQVHGAAGSYGSGLVLRCSDVNNYLEVLIYWNGVLVRTKVGGSQGNVDGAAFTPFDGDEIRALVVGSTVTVFYTPANGTETLLLSPSGFDTSLTGTKVGLWANASGDGASLDNFNATLPQVIESQTVGVKAATAWSYNTTRGSRIRPVRAVFSGVKRR